VIFQKMIDVLTPGKHGVATLAPVEVTRMMSVMSAFGGGNQFCPEGTYMSLTVHGQLMMSDTYFERNTNYDVVRNARGSVLIAGLGLGMIVLPIAAKPEVTEILVVEKYQDVIDLVLPQLLKALGPNAHKLKVICADVMEWKPPKDAKWDVIYFDVWPNLCTDNLDEMALLHRRFGRRYTYWMGSWARDLLKSRRRKDRRWRRF
jgi:hypothetical protein